MDDAKKVTEDSIKTLSDVSGKTAFDADLTNPDVDVKDEDVATIKNITTPDMVTAELKNKTADIDPAIINVYIVDETASNDATDPTKKITIGANNFDISVDDVKKALAGDEEILKKLSSVVAVAGDSNVATADIEC